MTTQSVLLLVFTLMAFGLVGIIVEWSGEKGSGWLALIVLSLFVLITALTIYPAHGHDHKRPELNEWLKSLNSKGGTWCCDGNDTDIIEDWDTKGGKYRVKFRGVWYDVPDEAVVDGPNRSGTPLLWMYNGWGEMKPRCFMPGTLS